MSGGRTASCRDECSVDRDDVLRDRPIAVAQHPCAQGRGKNVRGYRPGKQVSDMGAHLLREGHIRVLIASDVRLYCEGLASLFRQLDGIQILGGVSGATDTLGRAQALTPDVVLLDMTMEDAYAVARQIP